MKTQTHVVIIGGGVVGCSVLYHLTQKGWTDIMLVERSALTSGSTWHAAGGFHTLNSDTNMAALQGYTIKLYKELEDITGMRCGLHHVGGVTLANSPERLDFLKAERAKHRYMGLDTHIVTPEEIKKLSPIVNINGILGGLYDPLDGHLDPSGTTHAYAKAATMHGAEIIIDNPVIETNPRADGSWDVITMQGTIHCQHVVNAGGLWARELAAMANIYLPLHPMEHQYLVSEDIKEVYEHGNELPHIMDPAGESYLRQEGKGLVIGFYEQNCDPWAIDGTPKDFGHELLENNLDRISDAVTTAYHRFPVLEKAGIKNIINGPFTFAPDGNPLVGPVPTLKNYWCAVAVMAGFSQGGGVGLALSEWMVDGETSTDISAMDVARFGDWVTPEYTRHKVRENYQRRFSISYPNEELPAMRPFKTSPAYKIWQKQNAVFGAQYGMEAVNYFANAGDVLYETPTFRHSNAFDNIGAECRHVRTKVGINEIHNFGKYDITGNKAREWIDYIMAGRVPKKGRVTLTPMLSHQGKIIGDFTISCYDDNHFQLTASYSAQAYHMRWFMQHKHHDVTIENISDTLVGFQIAGPQSHDLLAQCVDADVSPTIFKFMDNKILSIANIDCRIQRLSYTGDLGYEIFCHHTQQEKLYHAIMEAGANMDIKPFGMRAMMSLRLEKFFGSWLREFKPDYTPLETGLDRFVHHQKDCDFIGKNAYLRELSTGASRKLCAFAVETSDADVHGDEPIFDGDNVIGFCTSGGYAHYSEQSIALGFLPTNRLDDLYDVYIEILGEKCPAKRLTQPLI